MDGRLHMDMVRKIVMAAVVATGLVAIACTTDGDLGVNSNSRLATLQVRNCELQPAFSSVVTDYLVVRSTNQRIFIKQLPVFYKTRVFANGVRYRPATNDIGLPDFTDLTRYLDEQQKLVLDCVGESGAQTRYTLTFIGPESDAGVERIDVVDSATGAASGSLYPFYRDGIAPFYRVPTAATNNTYLVNSTAQLTKFIVKKNTAQAKVYLGGKVNGTTITTPYEIGAGLETAEFTCNFMGGNQYNLDRPLVQCVSADGKYTNTKYIGVSYLSPYTDTRLLALSLGGNDGLYPEFYSEELTYYGATEVDSSGKTELKLKKAQPEQQITVSVYSNNLNGELASAPYYESTDTSNQSELRMFIPVNMGDILKVKVSKGANRTYTVSLGVFSPVPYNFDGGIRDLLEDITKNGENFKKRVVQGILTVKDFWGWENSKRCLFIEDGKAGLYVFLNDVVYGGLKVKPSSKFKIGCKVSMRITAGQVYYGMAEATAIDDLVLLDAKPRPLAYRTGGFDRMFARGKIWKYTETVRKALNARGEGEYVDASQYFVNRYKTYYYNPPLPEVQSYFDRFTPGFKATVYGPVIWSYGLHRLALYRPEYSVRMTK